LATFYLLIFFSLSAAICFTLFFFHLPQQQEIKLPKQRRELRRYANQLLRNPISAYFSGTAGRRRVEYLNPGGS
jgi:hypothetical protein